MSTNRDKKLNPFARILTFLTEDPGRSSYRIDTMVLANACAQYEQALQTITANQNEIKRLTDIVSNKQPAPVEGE